MRCLSSHIAQKTRLDATRLLLPRCAERVMRVRPVRHTHPLLVPYCRPAPRSLLCEDGLCEETGREQRAQARTENGNLPSTRAVLPVATLCPPPAPRTDTRSSGRHADAARLRPASSLHHQGIFEPSAAPVRMTDAATDDGGGEESRGYLREAHRARRQRGPCRRPPEEDYFNFVPPRISPRAIASSRLVS